MIFPPIDKSKRILNYTVTFCLDKEHLQIVNEFKYLGHVITSNLYDDEDCGRAMRSLYKCGNMLVTKFGKTNDLVKRRLLNAYCLPLFGCELWNSFRVKSSFARMSLAYHSCIKRLWNKSKFDSNRLVCINQNLLTFELQLCFRKLSFLRHLQVSSNDLIRNCNVWDTCSMFARDMLELYKKYHIENLSSTDISADTYGRYVRLFLSGYLTRDIIENPPRSGIG